MAPSIPQSVLVYDRIAQNRRKTILLVAIAILSVIPFVAGLSFGAADYTVSQFGHRVVSQSEFTRYQDVNDQAENQALRLRVTWVFALGITSVLGLLFWSLAASPTSQVLAMCGARSSGPAEAEAKRLLENLAIGAGLPTPKLYVIDSPVPNAFAAGMDPGHSVVAVTHGLLALLDSRELEGVLAHEISHIGNRDTRLNTVVMAIALFLRLPYLMRQRKKREQKAAEARNEWTPVRRRYRLPYTLVLLPVFIYVFFIAPLLAAVIRAAISRSREYQADADAALLTRYPEGLLRALAKIRGAGSAVAGNNAVISHLYFADPSKPGGLMGLFRGNLLATHPPLEDRINRLMEFNGGVPLAILEKAAHEGKDFTRDHPVLATPGTGDTMGQDELSVLTTGTPMGRVYRVLSDTTIYDRADLKSSPLAKVASGALVVVFDDPGKFRQVLTHDETFGYMPATVKLQRVDMLPSEIQDPIARKAAQAALGPVNVEKPNEYAKLASNAPASGKNLNLTGKQFAVATACFIIVFAGVFIILVKLGG